MRNKKTLALVKQGDMFTAGQADLSSGCARRHVSLMTAKKSLLAEQEDSCWLNKVRGRLAEQEDTCSCGPGGSVVWLNKTTCLLAQREDMSSCLGEEGTSSSKNVPSAEQEDTTSC